MCFNIRIAFLETVLNKIVSGNPALSTFGASCFNFSNHQIFGKPNLYLSLLLLNTYL